MCVCPGKSPAQQFTALIHVVTPLQSQVSPVVKLIIAVAKSKFCAQVGRLDFVQVFGKLVASLELSGEAASLECDVGMVTCNLYTLPSLQREIGSTR